MLIGRLRFGALTLCLAFLTLPSGAAGRLTVLHKFGGVDGALPSAGLVVDAAGSLYGVTEYGGTSQCGGHGCGAVFKLTPVASGYQESVIYSFGDSDAYPEGPLAIDGTGSLFGTSAAGRNGLVFKLTPTKSRYAETILYRFQGGSDGSQANGGLLLGAGGSLYGTTYAGGSQGCTIGCGTAFVLTPSPSGYAESVLYTFRGGRDGAQPAAGLIAGSNGALYGTTQGGGDSRCRGCGVVFKLTPASSKYSETILYRFRGSRHHDGASPGSLIADSNGALYGTTSSGGVNRCPNRGYGCGTVFKLTPTPSGYAESVILRFTRGRDGENPLGGLTFDGHGGLYGTTLYGGHPACRISIGPSGCGTVFDLVPSGLGYLEKVLFRFKFAEGAAPLGTLIADANGVLYGVTQGGGLGDCSDEGCGTVFKLTP
jgi:uncharacterized repeat protein (TIGR03803 family)